VILLTRLGGAPFALNPDLIERADRTPDTVITLVDGTKYLVSESLPELIELVIAFRASVLLASQRLADEAADLPAPPEPVTRHHGPVVVPLHRREQ
jgi:flagellar protein FlbD